MLASPLSLSLLSALPATADDSLPAEANFLVPTPLGVISYGLQKQAERQQACYDAGECLDSVPYYQLECERGDAECLARRRRLANKEIEAFKANPTGSPALLVFAIFLLGGPIAAVVRAITTLVSALLEDERG